MLVKAEGRVDVGNVVEPCRTAEVRLRVQHAVARWLPTSMLGSIRGTP